MSITPDIYVVVNPEPNLIHPVTFVIDMTQKIFIFATRYVSIDTRGITGTKDILQLISK